MTALSIEGLCKSFGNTPAITDVNLSVEQGDLFGLLGPNGSGKTTLLQLFLKRLEPELGTVKHGTKLEVAYFDQHRAQLDETLTVAENVSPHGDVVQVNGNNRHILSYLKDFLFTPETARAPIRKLSGGERARLLLARLFLQPANLLVMDEPTNDLDVETIELLEERLHSFEGTLLLVSHDRAFLNNVVTATYALDGEGSVTEYSGGCEQWLADYETRFAVSRPKPNSPSLPPCKNGPRKLLNKEREALENLPSLIDGLEAERDQLAGSLNSSDYYVNSGNDPKLDAERLANLETGILQAYEEWEKLHEIASSQ